MFNSLRQTKLRFRLLADGTILDQNTGKTAGYVTSQTDIERLWSMSGTQRQKKLMEYLKDK